MIRIHRANKQASGFSLIEILIAVVVLATGLLALASLQGSLSRSSAEAKVRSRVAGLLSARMDTLRVQGYSAIAGNVAAYNVTQNCIDGAPADLCAAMNQSGLGALTLVQAAQIYSSDIDAATFAPSSLPTGPTGSTKPQFVRINLTATWRDATNGLHRLAAVSEMSELAWNSNLLPNEDANSSQNTGPVVRQDNPLVEGMIPIAVGGGSDTAATNPKPIVVGTDSQIKETDFNVLTYHNDDATTVRVQQRVETRVVGCKCGFSASAPAGFAVLDRSYRPTFWDGSRYKTPEVANYAKSGAVAWPTSDTQADICTQCCRDHHDPVNIAADKPKFDPVRWNASATEAQNRFLSANLTAPVSTSDGVYNEACRVIRVDGLWRVASDAYAVQVGYLATEEADAPRDSLLRAKTRIIDKDYSAQYEGFVTDYMKDRFVLTDGVSVSNRYSSFNLDNPDDIGIKGSTAAGDERYLHTRGLYVDYIEPNTKLRIDDAVQNCIVTPTLTKTQCAMRHIPFTSINLTQLAAIVPEVISPASAGTEVITAATAQADLGKIQGVAGRTGASNAVVTAKISNTGLIGTRPIDDVDSTLSTVDGDRIVLLDKQKFTIQASAGASSPFNVRLNLPTYRITDGPGPNNPDVNWLTATGNSGCSKNWNDASGPNDYTCLPDATGTANVNLQVSRYHSESSDSPAVTCTNPRPDGGSPLTVAVSPTPRPVCQFYRVDTVVVSSGGGSVVTAPAVTADPNKYAEITTTGLSLTLPSAPLVTVNFIHDATKDLPATQGQCIYGGDAVNGYFVAAVTWTDQCK